MIAKTDLQQLIEYYELEIADAESLIKEYMAESEFKMAHRLSGELNRMTTILHTLHDLDDPFYSTRENLKLQKIRLEKIISEKGDNPFAAEQLASCDSQLKKIGEEKIKQTVEGQEFDDAIFDIVEGRKTGFRLHLVKKFNFWIDFRLTGEATLLISTTPTTEIIEDYMMSKYHKRLLKRLGFKKNKVTGSLDYPYDTAGFKTAASIKTIISRIIFDVYCYMPMDRPAFIEFHSLPGE